MTFRVGLMAFIAILSITILGSAEELGMEGGISTSISDSGSIQGISAADNAGAISQASSNGVVDEFIKDIRLDLDNKCTIDSAVEIERGTIDVYSETTKLTELGARTTSNLLADGSSVSIALSGLKGSNKATQIAGVGNGAITSVLGLDVGDSISAYQKTAIEGDQGFMGSNALTETNNMIVDGGFSGKGELSTELTAVADGQASMSGSVSMNGDTLIDSEGLQYVASNPIGVSTQGIFEDKNEDIGLFGLEATNVQSRTDAISTGEVWPGYRLMGIRWPYNPGVTQYVSYNSVPSYLPSKYGVWNEIVKARYTWQSATNEYTVGGTYWQFWTPGSYSYNNRDGWNTQTWTTLLGGSAIGLTRTWYSTSSPYVVGRDGTSYYTILESDIWYNANKGWRIDSWEDPNVHSTYDVRTIATHELGHTYGLSDLYAPGYWNQVMYAYNWGNCKWYLRSGDVRGLQRMYW
ncbi:MAG: matrixin family metalloprotease [Methanotrichaceae archaeon]|nr:matrixin family metalloprotease [Methanotrichaceae archaeon]